MANAECQTPNELKNGLCVFPFGIILDLSQRIVSISTFLIPVALALFLFETPTARHRDSLGWLLLLSGLIAAIVAALAGFICWKRLHRGLGLMIYAVILAGVYVPLICSRALPVKLHQLYQQSIQSTPSTHER